jgi:hypothetical protein
MALAVKVFASESIYTIGHPRCDPTQKSRDDVVLLIGGVIRLALNIVT